MRIEFSTAKDGAVTAAVNGKRLHSAYSPRTEAARFAQGISAPFVPRHIVITEPALAYALPEVKKRFPGALVHAVRYTDALSAYDAGFDSVLPLFASAPLAERLFSLLGEEGILTALFVPWKPSEPAFPGENDAAWKEIKTAVLKSRDVLATRACFAQRWARNAFRFAALIPSAVLPTRTRSPVVICASGPSLEDSLPRIAALRNRMVLMAVSSAAAPLLRAQIIPDMIVSTDGGYWAKPHLAPCHKGLRGVPVALSPEAACFAGLFESSPIVPLSYADGISAAVMEECGIPALRAERNGTVSGTAARLALSLTDSTVYFCGLDLAAAKGRAHSRPNENDKRARCGETRLSPGETRLSSSAFPSASLKVYRDWFIGADFAGRLLRIGNAEPLGSVRSVPWEEFEKRHPGPAQGLSFSKAPIGCPAEERTERLSAIAKKHRNDGLWIRDAFPALSVLRDRSGGTSQGADIEKSIEEGMEALEKKLLAAAGGART